MLDRIIEYTKAAFNYFALGKFVNNNPASFMNNVISAFSLSGLELAAANEAALSNLRLDTAIDENLNVIGDNYNLTRNEGTTAIGTASLWAYDPVSNIFIPANTILQTSNGQQFATTQDCIIFSNPQDYPLDDAVHPEFGTLDASPYKNSYGRSYAVLVVSGVSYDEDVPSNEQLEPSRQIPIEAIEIGREQNIDAFVLISSSINELGGINPITSVLEGGVENELPLSGGSDAETDEEYRARIKKHLGGSSTTTIQALENAALVPGIDSTNIIEPDDPKTAIFPPLGSVYMIVASSRAVYSPQWASVEANEQEVIYPVSSAVTLKEQIRNKLEDLRSVGVGVIVREADVVSVNMEDAQNQGKVIIYLKPGSDVLTETALIENELQTFFQSYEIGQNVYKSDVIELILSIDSVLDISPFILTADRWVYTSSVTYSVSSDADSLISNRDGITIQNNEIARPPLAFNIRVSLDSVRSE